MTKAELVARISEEAGITKTQADKTLKALVETIISEVKGGDRITLTGLGTFSLAEKAARTGRNPQTGASIQIPASKGLKFKASTTVKDSLN